MKGGRGGAFGLVGLVVVLVLAVSVLPWLRQTFARSFPEGFQNSAYISCKKTTCDEGQFCMEERCYPIEAEFTNKGQFDGTYFTGKGV